MIADFATTTTVLDVAHTLSVSANTSTKSASWLPALSFTSLGTIDWVIIGFLVVVAIYGLTLGKSRLVAIVFSTYITTLVVQQMLQLPFVPTGVDVMTIGLWIGLFLVITLIMSRSRALDVVTLFDSSWVKVVICIVLELGLVLSIFYQLIPNTIRFIPEPAVMVFNHPFALAVWLLLPLIAFAFVRGRIGRFDL